MRNITALFSLLLLLTACKKERTTPIDTSTLSFSFTANYDEEALVINEKVYEYNGKPIRFSKVNFYLSNVSIGDTEISDVNFINLTKSHTSDLAATTGTLMNFPKIPVGDYPNIAFGIGVPADLNRTKPSDYSTSHPLGADNSGEYWEAWDSYIFVKIEGQYDADDNGFDGNDVAFAYHVGQDEFYQKLNIPFEQAISLKADTSADIEFRLDIKKLLADEDGNLLALEAHDPNNQKAIMELIMNNFSKALRYVQ